MILAIDQSYSGTGAAYISSDGRIESILIKTRSSMPWEERIDFILSNLDDLFYLRTVKMSDPTPVRHVILESYAYSKTGANIFQLGELGGIIKYHFHTLGVDTKTMLIAHPKMYIAGNGRADKASVMKGLKDRFGIVETDDNVADAISIGLTYKAYLDSLTDVTDQSVFDRIIASKVGEYINGKSRSTKSKRSSTKSRNRTAVSFRPDNF